MSNKSLSEAAASVNDGSRLLRTLSQVDAQIGPGVYRYSTRDVQQHSRNLSPSIIESIGEISQALRTTLSQQPVGHRDSTGPSTP